MISNIPGKDLGSDPAKQFVEKIKLRVQLTEGLRQFVVYNTFSFALTHHEGTSQQQFMLKLISSTHSKCHIGQ